MREVPCMSINEQSLGRSPPKMGATERGVKWAVCVCILCVYIRHEVHSSNPASFSSNSRHLPVRAPSHVCARAMGWPPERGDAACVVGGVAGVVDVGVWVVVLPCTRAVAVVAWSEALACV